MLLDGLRGLKGSKLGVFRRPLPAGGGSEDEEAAGGVHIISLIMPQRVENKGMPCLSNSLQPSKKPGPRLCSYNPKLGACGTVPPPGKDPQESIVGLLLPGHPPHCLSVLITPSHGPANRHTPPKVTHRGSSTWIPHPENHEPLTAGSTTGRGQASQFSRQAVGSAHRHRIIQHARRWSGAHTSRDTVGTVTRTDTRVWGGRNMRAHI